MKCIAVLGSTGSIGTQGLEVASRLDDVSVTALSAHSNGELLARQAEALGVDTVAMSDPAAAERYAGEFESMGVRLLSGPEGVLELVRSGEFDLVLNAIVGSAGLRPTLAVLEGGTTLALANKESLVAGGRLVMDAARGSGAALIPVDSEHSAIFQCLAGEDASGLRRIILTASGGPFRLGPEDLDRVTVEDALAHPTWSMGPKVTIDSATLMNKGLEVLEAHHLFGAAVEDVEVVIHPQSIVHSMVEMVDGALLAHMGVPDMRIPVQYSLTWPERAACPAEYLDLTQCGELTFEAVDTERFPCLRLAREAGLEGATYPAAMNAANEEAVAAFLARRIKFTGIPAVVEGVLGGHEPLAGDDLDQLDQAEASARKLASEIIDGMEAPA